MSDSYSLAAEAEPVEDAIKKRQIYPTIIDGSDQIIHFFFFSHIC